MGKAGTDQDKEDRDILCKILYFLEQITTQFWPLSDTQVTGACWVADRYFWWRVLKGESSTQTAVSPGMFEVSSSISWLPTAASVPTMLPRGHLETGSH